jgi:hypothetical protein
LKEKKLKEKKKELVMGCMTRPSFFFFLKKQIKEKK